MTLRHEKIILGGGIAVFVLTTFAVCIVKYLHFGYNAFDLAIYNQTFWNTVHGRLFETSIHAPSYLGDHAEWLILALAPFYALVPHPLTLVFFKILAVAFSAIPLWMIAKLKFNDARSRLLFPLLWLANPFVWNLTFFEFHLITFSIPLTFLAAYYYLKRSWLPFIIIMTLILLCREDMAFVVAGFALLAGVGMIRQRAVAKVKEVTRWILIPLAMAAMVFIIDQKLIAHFNPDGVYKFFALYSWLGQTPSEMVGNLFFHPIAAVIHLVKASNLETAVALLLPFVFFSLIRPRFLLLIAITSAEYLLTSGGAETTILKTQYAAAFVPAITLAALEGYEYLIMRERGISIFPKALLPAYLLIATIYTWFTLGPGIGLAKTFSPPNERVKAIAAVLSQIPSDAPVVASMDTLTPLSSRQSVWPLDYVWIGKKQYGTSDYILPVAPEYMIIDLADQIYFSLVFQNVDWSAKAYPNAAANFRKFLSDGKYGVIFKHDGIAVLKRGIGGSWPFVAVHKEHIVPQYPVNKKLGPIDFLGYESANDQDDDLHLFFSANQKISGDPVAKINGVYYPLGNGIYPPAEWKPGETIEISAPIRGSKLTIGLYFISGGLNARSDGTPEFNIETAKPLGDEITIP